MKKKVFVSLLCVTLLGCGGTQKPEEKEVTKKPEVTIAPTITPAPTIEPISTPEPTVVPTEEPVQETVDETTIRPEFKETMDSYEAFFDEYIAFMNKYAESDDTASMMLDYLSYMSKYADMMDKMDAMDDGTLTLAETNYYVEVLTRINQKLLAVS